MYAYKVVNYKTLYMTTLVSQQCTHKPQAQFCTKACAKPFSRLNITTLQIISLSLVMFKRILGITSSL